MADCERWVSHLRRAAMSPTSSGACRHRRERGDDLGADGPLVRLLRHTSAAPVEVRQRLLNGGRELVRGPVRWDAGVLDYDQDVAGAGHAEGVDGRRLGYERGLIDLLPEKSPEHGRN